MPSLAVIDAQVFLPTIFTDSEKQPLAASARRQALDRDHGIPIRLATIVAEIPTGRLEPSPRRMDKHFLVVLYADSWSNK